MTCRSFCGLPGWEPHCRIHTGLLAHSQARAPGRGVLGPAVFSALPSLLFRVSPRYHPEQPQKLLFGHLGAGEGACPQEEGRSRKGKANQAPACLQLLFSPVPPAHIPVLPTPCHPAFLSPKSMLLWLGRADCLPVNSDGAQSRNVGRPGWLSLSVSHFRPVVAALAVPLTVIQA